MENRYFNVMTVVLAVVLAVLAFWGTVPAQQAKATTQLTVSGKWEYKDRDDSWTDAKSFCVGLFDGSTQDRMIKAGLPIQLASRLDHGR